MQGGPRLARLYGVDIRECVFGDVPEYQEQDGDVHLHPDYHGNYTPPSNAQVVGLAEGQSHTNAVLEG